MSNSCSAWTASCGEYRAAAARSLAREGDHVGRGIHAVDVKARREQGHEKASGTAAEVEHWLAMSLGRRRVIGGLFVLWVIELCPPASDECVMPSDRIISHHEKLAEG